MRVAVVAERTIQHAETDATTRIAEVASGLADRGHEVTVFCSQWWDGGETVPTFEADGVTYRAVTHDVSAPAWRFGVRLPRLLRRFGPDVIHAAHDPPVAVLGAGVARRFAGAPLVVDWYDDDQRAGWNERARRLAVRTPDRVTVPSHLIETGVLELGRDEERTTVVPDGIDMDAIRSTDPESVADIVYARRLDGDANLESLFLALAELRGLDWSLAVIGDGPERPTYERQASDFRIADRVTFMGAQPVERRIAIMKGSQVAVHTARHAPFPREFLRALACGCVGIAAYQTGSSAHELVETHDRGMRVSSEEELTHAIKRAAGMEHRTVDAAFDAFDEAAVLDRYLECYRELVGD
jgi:glycosyltransferase involved in cell wall biosynthesis